MNKSDTILSTQNLTVGYKDKGVLSSLNLSLKQGKLTCLLGPNGSGKSTLIRTITAIQKVLQGNVELEGKEITSISSKELAKKISLVLTDRVTPGNLTGYGLVSLGRFPYTSWMGSLSNSDKELIHWAMEVTGTLQFADRHIGELSDGEKQKIMIARALVQDTNIIILDEPTAHLDSPNRIEIFHLLQNLSSETNKTILISTHEIDMAIEHSDDMWLVMPDKTIQTGLPEDLILEGALEKAFGSENLVFDYSKGRFTRRKREQTTLCKVVGDTVKIRWTENALERAGLLTQDHKVEILETNGGIEWKLNDTEKTFNSIELLIKYLKIDENKH